MRLPFISSLTVSAFPKMRVRSAGGVQRALFSFRTDRVVADQQPSRQAGVFLKRFPIDGLIRSKRKRPNEWINDDRRISEVLEHDLVERTGFFAVMLQPAPTGGR